MAENRQPSKSEKKRERQPISVPFVWEEKPGTPKRDWKPTSRPIKPAEPPKKLVVSVPFGWEEKPGTPLPYFSQPPTKEPNFVFLSPPKYSDRDYGNQDDKGDDGSSVSEIDTCSFTTNDSFSSAKSLLANGLISTAARSSAVPVQQEKASLVLTNTNSGQLESPDSPASEADGMETRASFLEWLFPLLVPNSGLTEKTGCLEKSASQRADKEFMPGSNRSQVGKPLLTLGELIVMSRRRSYQRKAIKMQKQSSMDFMKRNAFACCIFGNGTGISGLQLKWKRQLQLKLM